MIQITPTMRILLAIEPVAPLLEDDGPRGTELDTDGDDQQTQKHGADDDHGASPLSGMGKLSVDCRP